MGLTMPHTALGIGYMFSQSSIDWNINASAYEDPGDHLVQPFHLIDEDTEAQRRKQLCSRLYRKLGAQPAFRALSPALTLHKNDEKNLDLS